MASNTLSIPDIISKKRDKGELTQQEIQSFVDAVVKQDAQPAQIGAWLMASYLQGLSKQEAIHLTRAMTYSGEVMTWPEEWRGQLVDKHSTGGVGDKVSLILAPALAACDLKVPMISGRGLSHTGGTLDKLESIPGFCVNMDREQIHNMMASVGCCIVGQTSSLVPADKVLYPIRDVTGTVASPALCTGSIISKKAAEGINSLVLDVKTGNAAFMKEMHQAEELAQLMVEVGCGLKIRTAALISNMDCPLGRAVGNALEVAESVHCLQGKGPHDLMDLVVQTGGILLHLSHKAASKEQGCQIVQRTIDDGSALAKFKDMIVGQGVAQEQAAMLCDVQSDVWKVLPPANHKTTLKCPRSGFIQSIEAITCARAAQKLGAGRTREGEAIDMAVGLYFLVSLGDKVAEGTPWVTVHYSTQELPESVCAMLAEALVIVPELTSPIPSSRVLRVIEPTL